MIGATGTGERMMVEATWDGLDACLRNYGKSQRSKIAVKSQTRDVIEESGYNDKGNRVAKGKFVVAAVAAEYLLGLGSDGFAVVYDMQIRLEFG
jgi:hypothetical protein